MSFNIGDSNSRFVLVSNPRVNFAFSDKVILADLRTSRKTGRPKIDKETGEIFLDSRGNAISERKYVNWEARFVGEAFESAKGLHNQMIDIKEGWIDKDEVKKGDKTFTNYYVTITEYVLSDVSSGEFVNVGDDPSFIPNDEVGADVRPVGMEEN